MNVPGSILIADNTGYDSLTIIRTSGGALADIPSAVDLLAVRDTAINGALTHVVSAGYTVTLGGASDELLLNAEVGSSVEADDTAGSPAHPGPLPYTGKVIVSKTRALVLPPDPNYRVTPPLPPGSAPIPGTGQPVEWAAGPNTFLTWQPLPVAATYESVPSTAQGGSVPSGAADVNQPTLTSAVLIVDYAPVSTSWSWNDRLTGDVVIRLSDTDGAKTFDTFLGQYVWAASGTATVAAGAASSGFTLEARADAETSGDIGRWLDIDWHTTGISETSGIYSFGAEGSVSTFTASADAPQASVQMPDYRYWIPDSWLRNAQRDDSLSTGPPRNRPARSQQAGLRNRGYR